MKILDLTDIFIDRNQPLQKQLYKALLNKIECQVFTSGSKLPSSRIMSESLGVSRNTIIQVIEQLKSEGFLVAQAGKGIFISSKTPNNISDRSFSCSNKGQFFFSESTHSLPDLSNYGESIRSSSYSLSRWPESLPFSPGLPDLEAFPHNKWCKLYRQNLDRITISGYGDSRGYLPLRKRLSEYLRISRGVHCSEEHIIITNGELEALDICIRVILNKGDLVLIENPGYKRARFLFKSMDVNLQEIQIENGTFNVDNLIKKNFVAKLLFCSPTHQYPLGGIMELKDRVKLLNWAEKSKCWIFEDDYESEFYSQKKPVAALQGLRKDAPVLYCGSFSKTLMPSLNLGYLVVPEPVAPAFIEAKGQISGPSTLLYQAILADFIGEGHFVRHIRRMRNIYQEKWVHFCTLIQSRLKSQAQLISPGTPMNLVIATPGHDDIKLSKDLANHGFGSTPLSTCYFGKIKRSGLILGCANTTTSQREEFISYLERYLIKK
ncbi:PLP-dependent aminotransferase family protein [Microbulbifer sp. DLAB2-AF]|uniref:MocR-like pyridoxine biosynthesis transcription factor PdxR n=1 Tax=Microbulbifer sp. DLAB2-AF TaxID=3243395 RepID=UPI004039A693